MTLGDRIIVMKGGVVQQSGSPLEVYNRPANRFVAGFIGTPAMNFLEGRLEDEGDAMSFASSVGRLPLPAKMAAALKPHRGASVVLGIRSEHLRLDGGGAGLVEEAQPDHPGGRAALADVLNGIAHDTDGDRLFVTGKEWPWVFEIELVAGN